MDIGAWLDQGLAIALVVAGIVFIDRRFWPWFTKEYWPEKMRQAQSSLNVLIEIRTAIVAMQTLQSAAISDRQFLSAQLQGISGQMIAIDGRLDNIDESIISFGTRLDNFEEYVEVRGPEVRSHKFKKGDTGPIPAVKQPDSPP